MLTVVSRPGTPSSSVLEHSPAYTFGKTSGLPTLLLPGLSLHTEIEEGAIKVSRVITETNRFIRLHKERRLR